MLRSCIVNLCEKGCTTSLPDKIFIEIALTNYPLQALLLIIKLYPKIILHEGVRKELCVKILCAIKVMTKIIAVHIVKIILQNYPFKRC